jgi:hypothetical protein
MVALDNAFAELSPSNLVAPNPWIAPANLTAPSPWPAAVRR